MTRRAFLLALFAPLGVFIYVTGCGQREFGQDARVPVSERHILTVGSPAGTPLNLPGEHGFNIHVKQSSQNKDAAGNAISQADATPAGKALAQADASKGGTAKAEFKIGHRIDNTTTSIQALSAEISFNLHQVVKATEVPAPATQAQANLVLLVIDSHKRPVSKTTITEVSSDEATGTANMPELRHITARLEPGESYDIVLYATVSAESDNNQQSTASLEIDNLKMSLTFAPSASQPSSQLQ